MPNRAKWSKRKTSKLSDNDILLIQRVNSMIKTHDAMCKRGSIHRFRKTIKTVADANRYIKKIKARAVRNPKGNSKKVIDIFAARAKAKKIIALIANTDKPIKNASINLNSFPADEQPLIKKELIEKQTLSNIGYNFTEQDNTVYISAPNPNSIDLIDLDRTIIGDRSEYNHALLNKIKINGSRKIIITAQTFATTNMEGVDGNGGRRSIIEKLKEEGIHVKKEDRWTTCDTIKNDDNEYVSKELGDSFANFLEVLTRVENGEDGREFCKENDYYKNLEQKGKKNENKGVLFLRALNENKIPPGTDINYYDDKFEELKNVKEAVEKYNKNNPEKTVTLRTFHIPYKVNFKNDAVQISGPTEAKATVITFNNDKVCLKNEGQKTSWLQQARGEAKEYEDGHQKKSLDTQAEAEAESKFKPE